MSDEDQLDDRLARLDNPRRVRVHDHALRDGSGTGGQELGVLLRLDETDAACAERTERGVVAERRNVYAVGSGRLKDRHARLGGNRFSVDDRVNLCHFFRSSP